jgi:TonB family protein
MNHNKKRKDVLFGILIASFILGLLITSASCSLIKKAPAPAETTAPKIEAAATVDTEYYSMVEKEALFQNGNINTFMTYLKKNTRYPALAQKKKQQGTAAVQFGVDCYGAVKIFALLKSSGSKILDDEAVRAIKASPKWTPAKVKDKSVGQLFILQIKFNLKTRRVEVK